MPTEIEVRNGSAELWYHVSVLHEGASNPERASEIKLTPGTVPGPWSRDSSAPRDTAGARERASGVQALTTSTSRVAATSGCSRTLT